MKLTKNSTNVNNRFNLTLITSQKPKCITKSFSLGKEGELIKEAGGAMTKGTAETLTLEPRDLPALLDGLKQNNALVYGVSDYDKATIVTKKALSQAKHNGGPPIIARDKKHLSWPVGAGALMLDYDPPDGQVPLIGDKFRELIYSVCPALKDTPHLIAPSASTFIYHGEKCLKKRSGIRFLNIVKNASDIPRALDALAKRLWLKGHGYIELSKAGRMLTRCPVDTAVGSPERLDFCAGAACKPPLEQRRPSPRLFKPDADPLDTLAAIPSLTMLEQSDYDGLVATAKAQAKPEARQIKKEWSAERVKVALAKISEDDREKAEAGLMQTYSLAVDKSILMGDFVLRHTSGKEITVGECLDDPDKWHGERFHDPLERSYGGNDSRIAWMNLRAAGRPYLYSHAHGGQRFSLVRARESLRLRAGERASIVRETLEGMRIFGTHYRRGNELVAITQDSEILPRYVEGIQWDLDSLFRFEKYNKTERLWLPCDCTKPIASGVLAAQGSWGLNELTGLTTAPILDPLTGRLIEDDGYDKKNRLMVILNDNSRWNGIPEVPTRGDVEWASETIWEPFKDFPFDGAISKSVMLAAFLTACIRPLLPTAPGFGFDAPTAGSGKTLLAKCLSIIAGDEPAMLPDAGDSEETRKRILALLRQNKRVVVLDNVTGILDSSALSAMLTAETYSDRVLGVSETITVPTTTLLLVTGNNITVAGDLCRRILICRIDPQDETPWKRAFDMDPAEYCREHRLDIVAAGLTIIRAGIQSGPEMPGRTASFEVWSDSVRRAVCLVAKYGVLDVTDPVESIDVAYGADPETGNLGALLDAWYDIWKDDPIKTSTLINAAQETCNGFDEMAKNGVDGELKYPKLAEAVDAICGNGKTLNPHRLGIWIGKNKARIVNDFRIVESEQSKKSHKVKKWRVLVVF